MKKSLLGLAAVVAAVVIAVVVTAGISGTSDPDVASESAKALPGQGIQVHGHWTFDVTNPDGSHAWTYEFENALVGGNVLAAILGRSITPGLWSLTLESRSLDDISPCGPSTRRGVGENAIDVLPNCDIIEAVARAAESEFTFKNLVVDRPVTGDLAEIVLTGSILASFNGSLEIARTKLTLCPTDVTIADCSSGRPVATSVETITETQFNRIELVDGQTMLVTVRISFS